MENAIVLKNIKKIFRYFKKDYMVFYWLFTKKGYEKEFRVLDGISFNIKKGEVVGILGRNGAGKSTILKIISGIYFPSSGTVEVDGTIASLLELGAGFKSTLTGRENIYLKGTLLGLSHDYIEAHIDDMIAFADIGDYIDMPLGTYSSGMAARLGFALAVNADPDILIIDEVFAVGDKNFQRKSRAKTEELLNSGKTVLFVSHSEQLISEFCNRVIYLKDGKVFYDGEVKKGLAIYHADNLNLPKIPSIIFKEAELSQDSLKLKCEYGIGSNNIIISNDILDKYKFFGTQYDGIPDEDSLALNITLIDNDYVELSIPMSNLSVGHKYRIWFSHNSTPSVKRKVIFVEKDYIVDNETYVFKAKAKDELLSFRLHDSNSFDDDM